MSREKNMRKKHEEKRLVKRHKDEEKGVRLSWFSGALPRSQNWSTRWSGRFNRRWKGNSAWRSRISSTNGKARGSILQSLHFSRSPLNKFWAFRSSLSRSLNLRRSWLTDLSPTFSIFFYLFEQLCRHLLQALLPDTHRVEGNQDDTDETGHREE
jgi:hypothetical protein